MKNQILVYSESQLLLVTVSGGSEHIILLLVKHFDLLR